MNVSGSVITAKIRLGAEQRGQTSGSTSYTWAISLAHVEWLSRSETESAFSTS